MGFNLTSSASGVFEGTRIISNQNLSNFSGKVQDPEGFLNKRAASPGHDFRGLSIQAVAARQDHFYIGVETF